MEAKLALIKSDKLNGLAEQLKDCSIEEQLQVLRYSSRCAFDKNSVGPDLLVIVSQACNRLASAKDFNLVTYYKSLYYIIQVAAKKDELLAALQLLPYISQLINHGHVNAESTVFIKSMYQLAWNLSLRCPDPVNALKLQQHSLIFLLSCDPNSLSKVVALAEMTASNFSIKAKSENSEMCGKSNSSSENTEGCCSSSSTSAKNDVAQQVVSFYHQILSSVLIHVSKSGTILPADVIDVITLISSCAIHQHTNVLKYSLKTLKSLCNQECYSAVYTGLQTLLAALKVQHFGAEAVSGLDAALGMVKQYHSIVNADDGARKVALHCLLCVLAALEDRDSQDATYLLSSIAGLEQTLSLVLTYCTPDADSSIKLKVVGAMNCWLRTLVLLNNYNGSSSNTAKTEALKKASFWCSKAELDMRSLLPLDADSASHYQNLGINYGNLGVLCYRAGDYRGAAACLSPCISLQESYTFVVPQQRASVISALYKKRSLLIDALRFSENFSSSATVLANQLLHYADEMTWNNKATAPPYDALIGQWFKLKKDAMKGKCSALQGVVLWSVVAGEIARQPHLKPDTSVQAEILCREFNAAVSAGFDYSTEQLECAVQLQHVALSELQTPACHGSHAKLLLVRSLLMCSQVVYLKPEIIVPKSFSHQVLSSELKKAKCLGQENAKLCCSWQLQHSCPALAILSFAVPVCSTMTSSFDERPFQSSCEKNFLTADNYSLEQDLTKKNSLAAENHSVEQDLPKKNSLAAGNHDSEQDLPKKNDACATKVARGLGKPPKTAARSKLKDPAELTDGKEVSVEWLETIGEVHCWLLFALQQHQEMLAKPQDLPSAPSSLTAATADLGDEQQPDDACDVRSNTVTLLHSSALLHAAAHLHAALHSWHRIRTGHKAPVWQETLCRSIAAVGHYSALHGRTLAALHSWRLLLHFSAAQPLLRQYKLKACCELIWSCPELTHTGVAEQISDELSAASGHDANTTVLASVTLAYYHFCQGQLSEGWPLLQCALRHDVVATKKTPNATIVQCLAHYTASLYSLLPHHLQAASPPLNPVAVAQIAARSAIALTHTLVDAPDVYWRWRIPWLHHLTCAWLARLSLLTAQPRLARAYLKEALSAAHTGVLPYRAAIAISLLAEVDLLCEQHDDCRVKLDTLLQLLSPRQPSAVQALDFSPEAAGVLTPKTTNKPCQDAVPLACGFTMKKIGRKHGSRGEKENSFVDALADSVSNMRIEAMRQAGPRDDVASPCVDSSNDDFVISDAQNKIGSHWLAIKSRLKFLSQASTKLGRYKLDTEKSTCPGSPSLEHRETALKLPLWSSPVNNNSEHEADREEEDVSSNSLLQAYFPGLCEVYLSVGAMLATLHRLGSRWQAAQDTIDTVCRAHDVMQQTAQQQCRHIYDVLGSAGYTPADAQRCGVYATNALLVGWCSVQQSAVQLLVARDRWTEALQLCNSAIESATALPVESVQRHHCHLLPLLQQARHLVNACNNLANKTRGGSPSLRIPLGSPVPCPTVGVITPRQSPTRSSDPPPLHRGPLNYPRSPRRRHDMSSDSDEDTVSLSNLSNETVPLQLKNKLNNLSRADDEPKVRGRSYRKNGIKAYGSRAEKSSDASKGSQASVGKRKLIPPKIIVIPESPETNPSVASCEKDEEMEDCKFNLLSAKQKIYNLCFSDKSSDKSDGVSSEEASLLPLNDANVKKSSLRLLRANAGSAANCSTTKTNEMKKNKLTTKKIPDSSVQPRRTRAKNKDVSDVENISEKKVVAKRAPRSTAETTRDERSEAATARRTRTAVRKVVS